MANPDEQNDESKNQNGPDQTPPASFPIKLEPGLAPDPVAQTDRPNQTAPVIRKLAKVVPLPQIKAESRVSVPATPEPLDLAVNSQPNFQSTTASTRQLGPTPGGQIAIPRPDPLEGGFRDLALHLFRTQDSSYQTTMQLPVMPNNQLPVMPNMRPPNMPNIPIPICVLEGVPSRPGTNIANATRHQTPLMGHMVGTRSRGPIAPMCSLNPSLPSHPAGYHQGVYHQRIDSQGMYQQGGHHQGVARGPGPPQIPFQFTSPTANMQMMPRASRATTDMVGAPRISKTPSSRPPYVKTLMGGRMIARNQMMSGNAVNGQAPQEAGTQRAENTLPIQSPAQVPDADIPSGGAPQNGPMMGGRMPQPGQPATATPAVNVSQQQVSAPVKRHQTENIPSSSQPHPSTRNPPTFFTPLDCIPPAKLLIMGDLERNPYVPNVDIERTFNVPLPPKPIDVQTWLSSCRGEPPFERLPAPSSQ